MSAVASFRDPAGSCFTFEDRIFRSVTPKAASELEHFLNSPCARTLLERGQIISTRQVPLSEIPASNNRSVLRENAATLFEHERISFPSYPYEWPPEMLFAAAALTLDLSEALLNQQYGLKDATPYNILFRGPKPIFIDVLSFEPRNPADPVWKPYAQFVRTFLLPLLANKYWGIRLADIFVTHRDGLEPQDIYRWCGPVQKLRPLFLSLVSIPTWLSRKSNEANPRLYQERTVSDPARAQFVLSSTFKSLRRKLEAVRPRQVRRSAWSGYMDSHSYSEAAFAAKEQFVKQTLADIKPKTILDVGANTGHFSQLAAAAGSNVVAIDCDAACVGSIWQTAARKSLNILPLVADIARPSPALGWRNSECPSFLDRARGRFDAVLMLAMLHHLLVSERIPLDQILQLAGELTRDALVIEFVGPEDAMFQHLARGRGHLHRELSMAAFEAAARRHFQLVRSIHLPETHRWLYLLRKPH